MIDSPVLEVENFRFSFSADLPEVLRGISFQLETPGMYAIIGPSGAGKTTLAKAILGINKPSAGEIRIMGETPDNYVSHHPGLISYVPQHPKLIRGSIFDNLALRAEPSAETLDRARIVIEQAGLSGWLLDNAQGLETQLNPQGLSGGQLQRIGLARALFTNPKILILDEPTSSLDADTESLVLESIKNYRASAIVIVIAHRFSTIVSADRVFVIEDGELTGAGTFNELKVTHNLVARQAELLGLK